MGSEDRLTWKKLSRTNTLAYLPGPLVTKDKTLCPETPVSHSTRNTKVKGLNPATAPTDRKTTKIKDYCMKQGTSTQICNNYMEGCGKKNTPKNEYLCSNYALVNSTGQLVY